MLCCVYFSKNKEKRFSIAWYIIIIVYDVIINGNRNTRQIDEIMMLSMFIVIGLDFRRVSALLALFVAPLFASYCTILYSFILLSTTTKLELFE